MSGLPTSALQHANYYGSLLQASTVCLGTGPSGDVYIPFRDMLPMVHPNDIVFDGKCWFGEGKMSREGGLLAFFLKLHTLMQG